MERPKGPDSAKKAEGNPPLRRGQIRNRIIRDFFKSLTLLGHPTWANSAVAGSGNTTPISSSGYNSEGTSD